MGNEESLVGFPVKQVVPALVSTSEHKKILHYHINSQGENKEREKN